MSVTFSLLNGDLKITTRDNLSGGNLTVDGSAVVGSLTVGGVSFTDKADKVSSATVGHLATFDAGGNLADTEISPGDFATASHNHAAADIDSGVMPSDRLPTATESQAGIMAVSMDNGLSIADGVLDINVADLSELFSRSNHQHNELKSGTTEYYMPDYGVIGGHFLSPAKSIAPEFDDETSYAVGDYVTHLGNLFRCATAHPAGATNNWNSDHFIAVKVAELIQRPLRQKMETTSGTITLADDVTVYHLSPVGTTDIAINSSALGGNGLITFELLISMPATAVTVDFSDVSLSWLNDETPDLSAGGVSYLLVLRSFDNGTTWVGNLQGYW